MEDHQRLRHQALYFQTCRFRQCTEWCCLQKLDFSLKGLPPSQYSVGRATTYPRQKCADCESSPPSFADASEVLALDCWSGLRICGSTPMSAGAFRREFPSNLHENIMEHGYTAADIWRCSSSAEKRGWLLDLLQRNLDPSGHQ